MSRDHGPIVGWREWVGFPELGVPWLKAKVDTGARTSSLHAENVSHETRADGEWARFTITPYQNSTEDSVEVELPVTDIREITSSNGTTEERIVVLATLVVGGDNYEIELTLTDRDSMGFRMLLGREALRGKFVVDPARSYMQGKPPAAVRNKNRRG